MELPGDLGNGMTLMDNLCDGVTLNGKGITRLLFRHGWIVKGKRIYT